MSKEKIIWVQPLFFKAEAKVDINHAVDKLVEAMKQDREIYYMASIDRLRTQLIENPTNKPFKTKTLEEDELVNEFLKFMEAKRKGFPAELNLKTY